ncbi:MAG: 3-dehydroquinate synthase [Candidatus Omnitrophica bacterium]|nr:3-dehydroquinate synthase [Candidatus Omnitrophota bacterium]
MISRIPVNLKDNPYSIIVGAEILGELPRFIRNLRLGKDVLIISHPFIERLHGVKLSSALKKAGYTVKILNVPEGEKSKSAACALRLLKQISVYDVDKKVFIVALGGGVIGDLAGFVAAIYKRGVPYIQVPTTLLAQIDSSIGGKTAIDLETGKNLVGAFYQPSLVFTDTKVLKTLSQRQIRNGLAEAIKYGIIADAKLFGFIETNYNKFFKGETNALNFIVRRCAQIKAGIVSVDEKETKALRTVLNFGHTVGHAVEAAGRYDRCHHGEAVGIGMRVAARISVALGLLAESQELRINQLITGVGLPEKIVGIRLAKILDLMGHDKKFSAGHNRFVLIPKIGQVKVVDDIPSSIIIKAIQSFLG